MNDRHTDATETAESGSERRYDIGARALALAGFAETALVEDPTTIISGHSLIPTLVISED